MDKKVYGILAMVIALLVLLFYGYFLLKNEKEEEAPMEDNAQKPITTTADSQPETGEILPDGSQEAQAYIDEGFLLRNFPPLSDEQMEGISRAVQGYLYRIGKSGYTYATYIETLEEEKILDGKPVYVIQTDATEDDYLLVYFDDETWYVQHW